MFKAIGEAVARSGPFNVRAIAKDLLHGTSLGQAVLSRTSRSRTALTREYAVRLPDGYPAAEIRVSLSVPELPAGPLAGFSEHVTDVAGHSTDTVLATMTGGFALSRDLGASWQRVRVRDRRFARHQFIHLKSLGDSELLAQAAAESWRPGLPRVIDNLVLGLDGEVLAVNQMDGSHWHGCRSVDLAGGTLMYAEYPYEDPAATPGERAPSRVLRSRDRGRSWQTVFERKGTQVRHFHFLQARPGVPGEWWLTSGDKPAESSIWVSKDDGDSWEEITGQFADRITIAGSEYPRTVFRLTDLVWEGDEIVWGTDDYLGQNRLRSPGSRMFRSNASRLRPTIVGLAQWPIRNIVDVGDFYMILTQSSARPNSTAEERRPAAYLMPKHRSRPGPEMAHLFDLDNFSNSRTGFTYSRASRAARNGTFFTYRASTDAFPFGHKILKWHVRFS
ncbi:MAG TPA: hypothetical protein VLC74_13215 [Rhizomicrobium sp.]|nr:hypothetical protein [Rhizomicrobium sp.]